MRIPRCLEECDVTITCRDGQVIIRTESDFDARQIQGWLEWSVGEARRLREMIGGRDGSED